MTNINTLWETPVPSSGSFFTDPYLEFYPRRSMAIVIEYEDVDGNRQKGKILFHDIVCYEVTYLPALREEDFCAYDKLVDMGDSVKLGNVVNTQRVNGWGHTQRHYKILFDDGPSYDIFASSFQTFFPTTE
jgi:hypothetical protein